MRWRTPKDTSAGSLSRSLHKLAWYEVLVIEYEGCVWQSREEMDVLFAVLPESAMRADLLEPAAFA